MDSETIWRIVTVLIGPAVAAIFIWYTTKFLPDKQKQIDDNTAYSQQLASSNKAFSEAGENSALQQVLSTQQDLIKHLIESNNGHLTKLTDAVLQGDRDHTTQLNKMTAAFNHLLVLMSRDRAALSLMQGVEDTDSINGILAAAVKSDAVEETDAIVAAGGLISDSRTK